MDFKQYQQTFTQRLRNPKAAMPEGVAKDRMAVYESLIFNNLLESVSQCFPVARSTLGETAWQQIVRDYFMQYASNTPIFREIPATFVSFLTEHASTISAPEYLSSLCHYEWVELALLTEASNTDAGKIKPIETAEDLLHHKPVFISPHLLLAYDYPVHTISADNIPQTTLATQLFVYRDDADNIEFVALNAMTYQLIQQLTADNAPSTKVILTELSQALDQPPESVINFGMQLLLDFYQKGMIIGYQAIEA